MAREKMKTIGGMSVRGEIESRLAGAREEARSAAFEEAISFLDASGHYVAADDLRHAAFDEPQGQANG